MYTSAASPLILTLILTCSVPIVGVSVVVLAHSEILLCKAMIQDLVSGVFALCRIFIWQ